MTVRAGDLNRRVRIERNGGGFDEIGQPIDGWAEVVTVWGNVKMLTGKETVLSNSDVGSATASIRIRYRTDITNGMRAVVDGVIFNILQALSNIAARNYTDLACETGSNNGKRGIRHLRRDQGAGRRRVYPDVAPATPVKPYIVYQAIGGVDETTFDGADTLQNSRMQVSVWSTSRSEAASIIKQVRSALTAEPAECRSARR